MSELSVLKNMVRTGIVSSVNAGNRTARVTFSDKGESPIVSGELKVLKMRHSSRRRTRRNGRKPRAAEAATRPLRATATPSRSAHGYRRRGITCFASTSRQRTGTGS